MAFQSTISLAQGFGVAGEQLTDGPSRAISYTIESASAAYNIIGATACSVTSQGFCAAGKASATAAFAGILVDPKSIALFGAGGQPLAPSLTVPNFTAVQCATMGSFVVTLPAAAAIGDRVIFDNVTGALSTIATDVLPVGKSFANALVDYYTVSGAGLAVITMTPALVIPQPV